MLDPRPEWTTYGVAPEGASCVRVATTDGVAVIALIGEHDLATLDAISQAIDEAVSAGHTPVIDLSGCSFIDCSVVGCLERARRAADAVVFLPETATPVVRRVAELTGLRTTNEPPHAHEPVGDVASANS
jgi:anti-anti-sigma factor